MKARGGVGGTPFLGWVQLETQRKPHPFSGMSVGQLTEFLWGSCDSLDEMGSKGNSKETTHVLGCPGG